MLFHAPPFCRECSRFVNNAGFGQFQNCNLLKTGPLELRQDWPMSERPLCITSRGGVGNKHESRVPGKDGLPRNGRDANSVSRPKRWRYAVPARRLHESPPRRSSVPWRAIKPPTESRKRTRRLWRRTRTGGSKNGATHISAFKKRDRALTPPFDGVYWGRRPARQTLGPGSLGRFWTQDVDGKRVRLHLQQEVSLAKP